MKLIPIKCVNLSNTISYNGTNYTSSTPCIIPYSDQRDANIKYICINRCNNFNKLTGRSRVINQIFHLDYDFNILASQIIGHNFRSLGPEGIEDVRLFNHNNIIHYIGSYKFGRFNRGTVGIFKRDLFDNTIINVPFSSDPNRWEKNWCFFDYNSELCVIYQWFPLIICKIDFDTKKLILPVRNFEE